MFRFEHHVSYDVKSVVSCVAYIRLLDAIVSIMVRLEVTKKYRSNKHLKNMTVYFQETETV